MGTFCIKKTTLLKVFLLTLLLLFTIFTSRTIYLQKTAKNINVRASDMRILVEVTPKDYIAKISALDKNRPYRIVFAPGNYLIPSNTKTFAPAIKPSLEYEDVVLNGGLLLEGFADLSLEGKSSISRPLFILNDEMGIFFKNSGKISLNNINFKGGKPRNKKPSSDLKNDPFRSQLLFRNVKEATLKNFKFEGVALPTNYQTESAAGIRGITVINDTREGLVFISNGTFKNVTWDNILIMGSATTYVNDITMLRQSKIIYDSLTQYPFSGQVGSAIASIKGGYVNAKNINIQGFMKGFDIDSARGAKFENIQVSASPDWEMADQFSGMWLIAVDKNPKSDIKGSLYINNFRLFPRNIYGKLAEKIPTYDRWFANLELLNTVSINDLSLAKHYYAGNEEDVRNLYSLLGLNEDGWTSCKIKKNISIKRWEIVLILRWENGGRWMRYNMDPSQFNACDYSIDEPKISNLILKKFPNDHPLAPPGQDEIINDWIRDSNINY